MNIEVKLAVVDGNLMVLTQIGSLWEHPQTQSHLNLVPRSGQQKMEGEIKRVGYARRQSTWNALTISIIGPDVTVYSDDKKPIRTAIDLSRSEILIDIGTTLADRVDLFSSTGRVSIISFNHTVCKAIRARCT